MQYNWISTSGIELKEGRDFSTTFGADSMSCPINESAVNKMHLKYPVIGTKLGSNTVIGVFKDFIFNDPSHNSKPLIVYLNRTHVDHFLVRITNNGSWEKSVSGIEQLFKKMNPEFPFDFRFTRQQYETNFQQIRAVAQMGETFGGMAIFISCMGLFGLSAFLAERRKKELGIRKVLGSTITGLWFYLSKDFLKPVIIAFLIAAPVAGLVMDKVLAQMDYHISLSWWMFALAGTLALVIALVTVSVNGIRAAMANPAISLAAE